MSKQKTNMKFLNELLLVHKATNYIKTENPQMRIHLIQHIQMRLLTSCVL